MGDILRQRANSVTVGFLGLICSGFSSVFMPSKPLNDAQGLEEDYREKLNQSLNELRQSAARGYFEEPDGTRVRIPTSTRAMILNHIRCRFTID